MPQNFASVLFFTALFCGRIHRVPSLPCWDLKIFNTILEQKKGYMFCMFSWRKCTPMHPKKGLGKGLRRCWAAPQSSCHNFLSYKHFPPAPCFVPRVHAKLPVFRDGAQIGNLSPAYGGYRDQVFIGLECVTFSGKRKKGGNDNKKW